MRSNLGNLRARSVEMLETSVLGVALGSPVAIVLIGLIIAAMDLTFPSFSNEPLWLSGLYFGAPTLAVFIGIWASIKRYDHPLFEKIFLFGYGTLLCTAPLIMAWRGSIPEIEGSRHAGVLVITPGLAFVVAFTSLILPMLLRKLRSTTRGVPISNQITVT